MTTDKARKKTRAKGTEPATSTSELALMHDPDRYLRSLRLYAESLDSLADICRHVRIVPEHAAQTLATARREIEVAADWAQRAFPMAFSSVARIRLAARAIPRGDVVQNLPNESTQAGGALYLADILETWHTQYYNVIQESVEEFEILRAPAVLPEETKTFGQVVGRLKSDMGYGDSELRTVKNRIQLAMAAGHLVSRDEGKTFTADSVEEFVATKPKKREVPKSG